MQHAVAETTGTDKAGGPKVVLTHLPDWYGGPRKEVGRSGRGRKIQPSCSVVWEIMRSTMKSCLGTRGQDKHMKERNMMSLIKTRALEKAERLKHTSLDLIKAQMDLFEIRHCRSLLCFSDSAQVDRAGIKHELQSRDDFVLFYLPAKSLVEGAKTVVPVVTYSKPNNVCYLNRAVSTIATYFVRTGLFCGYPTYFVQEVLALEGRETLDALKLTAGNSYEFWDLSLEVPTHPDALTPSFVQAQLCDLTGRPPRPVLPDRDLRPMLCLNDNSQDPAAPDAPWLNMDDMRPGLCDGIEYATYSGEQDAPGLQVKRVTHTLNPGKDVTNRINFVVPVISQGQYYSGRETAHASTTRRFLKAIEHTLVTMGKGELFDCHRRLLLSLTTGADFLSPPELRDEDYTQALKSYGEIVKSDTWVGLAVPKHIDRAITNPVRNQTVTLAVKLLAHDIPDPFAVAELLCGSSARAEEYLAWFARLSDDKSLVASAKRANAEKLRERMAENWDELQHTAEQYCRARQGPEDDTNGAIFRRWAALFGPGSRTAVNAGRALSMWTSLRRSSQWNKKTVSDAKAARLCAGNARVLMQMLKDDQRVIQLAVTPPAPRAPRAPRAPPAPPARDARKGRESGRTGEGGQQPGHFLLPRYYRARNGDPAWIKNLFQLLTDAYWTSSSLAKRNAVCAHLDVYNTLLARRTTFHQWAHDHFTELENYCESTTHLRRDVLSAALGDKLTFLRTAWFNKGPKDIERLSVFVDEGRANNTAVRLRAAGGHAHEGRGEEARRESKRAPEGSNHEAAKGAKRACKEPNVRASCSPDGATCVAPAGPSETDTQACARGTEEGYRPRGRDGDLSPDAETSAEGPGPGPRVRGPGRAFESLSHTLTRLVGPRPEGGPSRDCEDEGDVSAKGPDSMDGAFQGLDQELAQDLERAGICAGTGGYDSFRYENAGHSPYSDSLDCGDGGVDGVWEL